MDRIYQWLFPGAWIAFFTYWLVSAAAVRRIRISDPWSVRIVQLFFTVLAIALMASPRFDVGVLAWRLWPQNRITFFTGAAFLLAGLAFAVWARVHLGQFWSARVALKEGHQLIRSGPYSLVRHPIYTGILTAVAGSAVAVGQLRGAIAFVLLASVHFFKSRREERLLMTEFGEEYMRFRNKVPALVPFLF
jgi:protein-S-isoprenylcysteine O-methyltransferase Ste14